MKKVLAVFLTVVVMVGLFVPTNAAVGYTEPEIQPLAERCTYCVTGTISTEFIGTRTQVGENSHCVHGYNFGTDKVETLYYRYFSECNNCSVGLVHYKSKNKCSCRYCDTDYKNIECNNCGSIDIAEWGAGTEKVAEFMESMFPNKVVRIDMDNTSTIKSLSAALKSFEKGDKQILVGTQLVAKGLHFPNVTLVGILGIDNIVSMPDFRALERAYQLLIQVSGRAGREALKGKVYIQTFMPESPILKFIENNDYKSFYDYELNRRENVGFPPYSKLVNITISYTKEIDCKNVANIIAKEIKKYTNDVIVLGPRPAYIYMIKNRYRITILLKSNSHSSINKGISVANNTFEHIKIGSMIMKIDKDPYFLN